MGMPGFVANAGLAQAVLPLDGVAAEIERRTWMRRSRALVAISVNRKEVPSGG